jgi:hypothetical protein
MDAGKTNAMNCPRIGYERFSVTRQPQILSQHSQIRGAGELKDVSRLVADLPAKIGTTAAYPDCLTAATVRDLAEAHLQQLTRHGGSAARVTDKMLDMRSVVAIKSDW